MAASTKLAYYYIELPAGDTSTRPPTSASVSEFGWFRANTQTGYLEYYDSDQDTWIGIGAFAATGGSTNTYTSGGTSYQYHVFTSSGTFQVTSGSKGCDAIIVGGGGGGGGYGGGGGAGAVIYMSQKPLSTGAYSVTIGAGGSQTYTEQTANEGSSTSAFGYTATGGGRGGAYNNIPSSSGANGGGAGAYGYNEGSYGSTGNAPSGDGFATVYAGYSGGNHYNSTAPGWPLSGGAGAGGNGGTANNTNASGNGGSGVALNLTGTSYYWGGGGGGGSYTNNTSGGSGGIGGGGGGAYKSGGGSAWNTGGSGNANGGAGGANTGAGGGGGDHQNNGGGYGGAGGSGIVIVRYQTA